MQRKDQEHFRERILELIRDYPDEPRLEYLRNYVAESPCFCHATHQAGNQAPGPHGPTAKALGFILDEVAEPDDWVTAVAINGQTGRVIITTYSDGGDEREQEFNLRGVSAAV